MVGCYYRGKDDDIEDRIIISPPPNDNGELWGGVWGKDVLDVGDVRVVFVIVIIVTAAVAVAVVFGMVGELSKWWEGVVGMDWNWYHGLCG